MKTRVEPNQVTSSTPGGWTPSSRCQMRVIRLNAIIRTLDLSPARGRVVWDRALPGSNRRSVELLAGLEAELLDLTLGSLLSDGLRKYGYRQLTWRKRSDVFALKAHKF